MVSPTINGNSEVMKSQNFTPSSQYGASLPIMANFDSNLNQTVTAISSIKSFNQIGLDNSNSLITNCSNAVNPSASISTKNVCTNCNKPSENNSAPLSTASIIDSVNTYDLNLNELFFNDKELFQILNLKKQHQILFTPQKSLKATGSGVGVTIMMKPIHNSGTAATTTVLNKNLSNTSHTNLRKSQDKLFNIGN